MFKTISAKLYLKKFTSKLYNSIFNSLKLINDKSVQYAADVPAEDFLEWNNKQPPITESTKTQVSEILLN